MTFDSEFFQYHRLTYNLFLKTQALKTRFWYNIFLKKSGKGCIIIKPLFISFNRLELGNGVSIRNNSRIEAVVKYNNRFYDPRIVFFNNVSIEQNIHLTSATYIEVGENTSISANVTITDINHPYTNVDLPIEKQTIETKKVIVGKDCKIYNNVVILPGTIIGNHCTVGANSVVSGVFPDYCVIAGSPAKIVKQYSFEKQTWLRITD